MHVDFFVILTFTCVSCKLLICWYFQIEVQLQRRPSSFSIRTNCHKILRKTRPSWWVFCGMNCVIRNLSLFAKCLIIKAPRQDSRPSLYWRWVSLRCLQHDGRSGWKYGCIGWLLGQGNWTRFSNCVLCFLCFDHLILKIGTTSPVPHPK